MSTIESRRLWWSSMTRVYSVVPIRTPFRSGRRSPNIRDNTIRSDFNQLWPLQCRQYVGISPVCSARTQRTRLHDAPLPSPMNSGAECLTKCVVVIVVFVMHTPMVPSALALALPARFAVLESTTHLCTGLAPTAPRQLHPSSAQMSPRARHVPWFSWPLLP